MKRLLVYSTFALAAVAALTLAACSSGGSNAAPTPFACTAPSGLMQVYPAPGATAVPDTTSAIYVAVPSPLPGGNAYDLYVVGPPSYGAQYTRGFSQVTPQQVPSPAATPSYANPVYYVTQLSAPLQPASVFQVYFNDQGSQCTPQLGAALGAFTTQ